MTKPLKNGKPSVSARAVKVVAYEAIQSDIAELLRDARLAVVRTANSVMTATYWEVGRRIVEAEQKGRRRAGYGEQLLKQLAIDLTAEFGRGFSDVNLRQMRSLYQLWPPEKIQQTVSAEFKRPHMPIQQTLSAKSSKRSASLVISPVVSKKFTPTIAEIARAFPLPWSAYVSLLSVESENARGFYESEALRGGWSVRQLDRQIDSQFYERTALSRNKAAMLTKGQIAKPEDAMTLAEVVKDPYVLEFLDLKDEYSESDLEEALIRKLEDFLLELGDDFAFVGRQKRLRLDDQWFRVDLAFFHRALRCLVLIDLKLGKFSHADAGQMHMYLNYAKAHWTLEGENPPVGLILCSQKGKAQAHYALDGLPNKVMAAQYKTLLPSEEKLALEMTQATRRIQEQRGK